MAADLVELLLWTKNKNVFFFSKILFHRQWKVLLKKIIEIKHIHYKISTTPICLLYFLTLPVSKPWKSNLSPSFCSKYPLNISFHIHRILLSTSFYQLHLLLILSFSKHLIDMPDTGLCTEGPKINKTQSLPLRNL